MQKVSDELEKFKEYLKSESNEDLQNLFKEISELTKKVKEEIYWLLVNEFKYFE